MVWLVWKLWKLMTSFCMNILVYEFNGHMKQGVQCVEFVVLKKQLE